MSTDWTYDMEQHPYHRRLFLSICFRMPIRNVWRFQWEIKGRQSKKGHTTQYPKENGTQEQTTIYKTYT
jgi:hypothetical protein